MSETLLITGAGALFCLLAVFSTVFLVNIRPKKIARRIALLEDSFERLKSISYELLRNVDELDQSKKFEIKSLGQSALSDFSLENISSNSALLSESLETIELLLKKRKLNEANQILGASAKLAEKIQSDLQALDTNGIVLKIESKHNQNR